jgi:hypothetical protein
MTPVMSSFASTREDCAGVIEFREADLAESFVEVIPVEVEGIGVFGGIEDSADFEIERERVDGAFEWDAGANTPTASFCDSAVDDAALPIALPGFELFRGMV